MSKFEILQPASVLALFTLAVLLLMPFRRIGALFANQVSLDDFKYGESSKVPHRVAIVNRNYMNLLELPVLFYVASLLIFVVGAADTAFVYLAWGYVGLRVVHSAVHLTYNDVWHRTVAFAFSNMVLAVIWIRVLLLLW